MPAFGRGAGFLDQAGTQRRAPISSTAREVTLDVIAQGRATDPWGHPRAGFEARTTIKRSDIGLTWNQALEAGGVLVVDEVKIALDVELVADQAR